MSSIDLDPSACRGRQQRLTEHLLQNEIELAVVNQPEHVQWLSGVRLPWVFQVSASLSRDGELTLCLPERANVEAAADTIIRYEAKWHSTLRNDQREVCSGALHQAVGGQARGKRLGVEFSTFGRNEDYGASELLDMEPTMYQLRRRKDADELARLQRAIEATRRMYEAARSILKPGLSEIEMFNELQSAAVSELGEMLTGTGNDYQCASRGGPPRNGKKAEAGQLYILDLGPAFRGYFADNCRTLAVTEVSQEQQQAWEQVVRVFDLVDAEVRPGKSAKELFEQAQSLLDEAPVGVFNHHLGHGIGLFPHEGPHLNPHWDDIFEEGDVFTAEPGLYAPELKAGMRIENDYLVTANGVELLTPFPLELKL